MKTTIELNDSDAVLSVEDTKTGGLSISRQNPGRGNVMAVAQAVTLPADAVAELIKVLRKGS